MILKMTNLRGIAAVLATSGIIASATPVATASPLESLKESRAMQDFKAREVTGSKRSNNVSRDTYLRGIDPTSNFATVWRTQSGGLELLNWAGSKLPHYRSHKPRSDRKDEVVVAEMDLLDNKKATATITIVVPHPSMAPLVEANVLPETRIYRPPVLKVVSEKTIAVSEGTGTLYETEKGGCVIVIPLAQQSLLNVSMVDCKNTEMLIDIAKSLDISRLNRKLNS